MKEIIEKQMARFKEAKEMVSIISLVAYIAVVCFVICIFCAMVRGLSDNPIWEDGVDLMLIATFFYSLMYFIFKEALF
jgi:ABC-type multidrug transport system permease subunit